MLRTLATLKLRPLFSLLLVFAVVLTAVATYGIVNSQSGNGKYDTDGDGLIEIEYLEQLDAIRYDTDGDGWADEFSNIDKYAVAFPITGSELVCNEGCIGYELVRSLDFDSAASYVNGINQEWRTGNGWIPMGLRATLDGRGNAISNLYINSKDGGLFFSSGSSAVIKRVRLLNANVTGWEDVGALVGENYGMVSHSYATGSVTLNSNDGHVGGLVGRNFGIVSHSYATVTVAGNGNSVGGLVGVIGVFNGNGGTVNSSYASGSVSSSSDYVGGLVGRNLGTVRSSYATGTVTSTGNRVGGLIGYNSRDGGTANIFDSYATGSVSGNGWVGGLVGQNGYSPGHAGNIAASFAIGSVTGNRSVGGLIGYNYPGGAIIDGYWNIDVTTPGIGNGSSTGAKGQTSAQLQKPVANTGIYANWNVQHWDFGTSRQYPVLKVDFNGDGEATWWEFGTQIGNRPTPTPTNTPTPSATPTETPTPVPTNTPVLTPTNTPKPTPTNTPSPTPEPELTPTEIPASTHTPVPTPTLVPPADTATPPVQVVTVVVTATPRTHCRGNTRLADRDGRRSLRLAGRGGAVGRRRRQPATAAGPAGHDLGTETAWTARTQGAIMSSRRHLRIVRTGCPYSREFKI